LAPYLFNTFDDLSPYSLSSAGIITGSSGETAYPARTATITVTDANGATASVVIAIGIINGGLSFVYNATDHGIPTGQSGTAITARNLASGVIGGTSPYSYSTVFNDAIFDWI